MKLPAYCVECRKTMHASEEEAREAIANLLRYRRKVPPNDYALRPYKCRVHEGGWHYGHSVAVIAVIQHMTGA